MTTIEAVIFDYGGVLSTTPFVGLAELEAEMGYPRGSLVTLLFGESRRRAGAAGGDAEAFLAAYDAAGDHPPDEPPDWHLLETGRLGLAEFHERLVARSPDILGAALDLSVYTRYLQTLAVGVHWSVIHRIRELRQEGYRTAILTNNIREWGDFWRGSIPIDLFDVVVDSSEVGLRKPDHAIFQLTCDRLGVAPAAAVFLDDSPRHVRAAEAFGLAGIVFGDPGEGLAALDKVLGRAEAA